MNGRSLARRHPGCRRLLVVKVFSKGFLSTADHFSLFLLAGHPARRDAGASGDRSSSPCEFFSRSVSGLGRFFWSAAPGASAPPDPYRSAAGKVLGAPGRHVAPPCVGALDFDLGALVFDLGALHYDVGALDYDVGALHYDVGALDYDVGTLDYDLGALHYDLGALDYDLGAPDFDLGAIDFDLGTLDFDVEAFDFDVEAFDVDVEALDFDLGALDFEVVTFDVDVEALGGERRRLGRGPVEGDPLGVPHRYCASAVR
jgi:hypothetical protein